MLVPHQQAIEISLQRHNVRQSVNSDLKGKKSFLNIFFGQFFVVVFVVVVSYIIKIRPQRIEVFQGEHDDLAPQVVHPVLFLGNVAARKVFDVSQQGPKKTIAVCWHTVEDTAFLTPQHIGRLLVHVIIREKMAGFKKKEIVKNLLTPKKKQKTKNSLLTARFRPRVGYRQYTHSHLS